MLNFPIPQPKFIYFDAGDVLVERKTKDGDNIAREQGFDPADYEKISAVVVALQLKEEVEEFNHIKTLTMLYNLRYNIYKMHINYKTF